MRIGVLGTGGVGHTLASALVRLGHAMRMGSRTAGDIIAARGMEMYLPLWLRLRGATGTGVLNVEARTTPSGP